MAKRIKGIKIEIGGETTGFQKALKDLDRSINTTQYELKQVNKALKLDPKNTELVAQKQKLLAKATEETKTKLEALKEAKAKADEDMKNGTEINEKQYRELQREIVTTESNLKKLEKETKDLKKSSKLSFSSAAESLKKFGNKAVEVGKELTKKVTTPIVALGGLSLKSFKEVDEGYDNMIAKTGASGKEAEKLEEIYKNVSTATSDAFADAGNAVGEINTRLEFTGKKLENASVDFLKFARVNDMDVNNAVQKVSRAMGDAGMKSENYNEMLDMLTKAAQKSGISMDGLTENLTKYGAPMRNLGFDTKESIAMFSGWEKAGVNTEIAFGGMKQAIGKWSKQDKDSRKEFKKTLKEIQEAPDKASATGLAIEAFGQRAGPDLADAIQGGRFEFEGMLKAIEDSDGTTTDVFETVAGDEEDVKKTAQDAQLVLADLGDTILVLLAPIFKKISKVIKKISKKFSKLSKGQKKAILIVSGIVAAIGPLLVIIGKVALGLAVVIPIIGTVVGAIGGIPLLIAGVIATIVLLWNHCDGFREFLKGIWEWMKETGGKIANFFTVKIPLFFKKRVNKIKKKWSNFKKLFESIGPWVKEKFQNIWDDIKGVFSGVGEFFGGIWDTIKEKFTTIGSKIGSAVSGAFKGVINTVLKTAGNKLNGAIDMLNKARKYINKIPGVNIGKINEIEIPQLAKGGVLSSGQAIVAEAGPELIQMMNGKTVVTPLTKTSQNTPAIKQGTSGNTVNANFYNQSLSEQQVVQIIQREMGAV